MEPFEDELLAIEKAIAGETQAMESLLQLHHERLLSYVTRHLPPDLKNIVDPMDVVQDTYFEACRQMAGFRPMGPDSFHRWLVTIARHRMVDLLRLYRARRRAVNWKQADDSVLYMLDQLAVYRRTPSRSAASRVDGRGEPHVLDFGLARLTRPDQAHWRETQVTVMGHVIGSVPWASPEQVSGDVARMSAASDVYSFGVMLYQALTGRDPYPMDGTIKQMIEIICGTKPADPAQFTDCPFGRIDRRLADIILKTLEKDPTRRYATAGPLADDLDAYLAGQPTRAEAMRRWRRSWLWAVGAALALAAATGGGGRCGGTTRRGEW